MYALRGHERSGPWVLLAIAQGGATQISVLRWRCLGTSGINHDTFRLSSSRCYSCIVHSVDSWCHTAFLSSSQPGCCSRCVNWLASSHMALTTGDMPAYQIRAPTTALPQGMVITALPRTLHSPQQLAEEATHERELTDEKQVQCSLVFRRNHFIDTWCITLGLWKTYFS